MVFTLQELVSTLRELIAHNDYMFFVSFCKVQMLLSFLHFSVGNLYKMYSTQSAFTLSSTHNHLGVQVHFFVNEFKFQFCGFAQEYTLEVDTCIIDIQRKSTVSDNSL